MSGTAGRVEQSATDLGSLARDYQALERQRVETYRTNLAILANTTPHLPPAQPRMMTVPRILNKPYDENLISDLLAYLLNPVHNGVGIEPLARLVEHCFGQTLPEGATVVIEREHTFNRGGRIDLLISIDDAMVLGIENKVFASENPGQTGSYARAMAEAFPDAERLHLFLTRDGARPRSKLFVPISYGELVALLRQVRIDWQADIHKAVLWEDFLTHMEEHLDMSKSRPTPSEQVKLYAEHHEMIRDLQQQYDTFAEELFQYVVEQVQAQYPASAWHYYFTGARDLQQFWKPQWRANGVWVHFEPYFSRDLIWQREMEVFVEIEGRGARRLLEKCNTLAAAWQARFAPLGILYRPAHRNHAIAAKTYTLDPEQDPAEQILAALDEMMFVSEFVEEALATLGE